VLPALQLRAALEALALGSWRLLLASALPWLLQLLLQLLQLQLQLLQTAKLPSLCPTALPGAPAAAQQLQRATQWTWL
jgi:hypothetical protein